ncbi:hypothetical protein BK654_11085 [Pseudomonas brassicacearum]|nr:hypothetical protein BK654_11085 [Pseudomonas brassicacearum]
MMLQLCLLGSGSVHADCYVDICFFLLQLPDINFVRDVCQQTAKIQPFVRRVGEQSIEQVVAINKKCSTQTQPPKNEKTGLSRFFHPNSQRI